MWKSFSPRVQNDNSLDGEKEAANRNIAEKLQTVEKIVRVKAMLDQNKKIDETQEYMKFLKEVVAAGRATLRTYAEISETNIIIEERCCIAEQEN